MGTATGPGLPNGHILCKCGVAYVVAMDTHGFSWSALAKSPRRTAEVRTLAHLVQIYNTGSSIGFDCTLMIMTSPYPSPLTERVRFSDVAIVTHPTALPLSSLANRWHNRDANNSVNETINPKIKYADTRIPREQASSCGCSSSRSLMPGSCACILLCVDHLKGTPKTYLAIFSPSDRETSACIAPHSPSNSPHTADRCHLGFSHLHRTHATGSAGFQHLPENERANFVTRNVQRM